MIPGRWKSDAHFLPVSAEVTDAMVSERSRTRLTRRRWLGLAALTTAGLAGCVEGSSGSTAATTRPPTETPSPTATPTPAVAPASVLGGRLDDVDTFDGEITNARGQSTVTIRVGTEGNGGHFAFEPAAVHVDTGTTVRFEWTGNGGGHNVVSEDGILDSGEIYAEPGVHYEHTFEADGVYVYQCEPHAALEMFGAVVVGDDYEPLTPTPTETPDEIDSGGDEDDGPPVDAREFDGWLADTSNYDGVVDVTGHEQITVQVGGPGNDGTFAFEPAAIRVDPGTTVQFQWTGEGGSHNVVGEDGTLDSGAPASEPGVNYEVTVEESGVHRYYCEPHRALGMRGVIVVPEDGTTAD